MTENDKNDKKHEVIHLQLNSYDNVVKKNPCFYSSNSPATIFNVLVEYFKETGQDFTMHNKKSKMTYTRKKVWVP